MISIDDRYAYSHIVNCARKMDGINNVYEFERACVCVSRALVSV